MASFLEDEDEFKGIKNPVELDLFAMETQARKIIHNLVAPMLKKMDQDRENT